jgi:hypothetical protein
MLGLPAIYLGACKKSICLQKKNLPAIKSICLQKKGLPAIFLAGHNFFQPL